MISSLVTSTFRILFKVCLSSLHAPIPYTEIKQRSWPVGAQGQDQHKCKSYSLSCPVSSEQPPAVCPYSHFTYYLQPTSEDTSLWLFPHRRQYAQRPVDVTKLLHLFYCWTPIWLSHHWAWHQRGYWRYRNLFDWLIDDSKTLEEL